MYLFIVKIYTGQSVVSLCVLSVKTNLYMSASRWVACSSQCSMTGVTKAVVCVILSGGTMHIKEPLLLIGKSSPCGGSWFPLSLSEWSDTI